MKIQLTKRNTIATCLAAPLAAQPGTQEYHMKAIGAGGKSAQHVGKAIVYPDGLNPWKHLNSPGITITEDDLNPFILVETCAGKRVGKAKSKDEARQMIHDFHKSNPMYIGHNQEIE